MADSRINRGRFAPTSGRPDGRGRSKIVLPGAAWMISVATLAAWAAQPVAAQTATGRNVVIFVADGLRPGSVNPTDAPTLLMIRTNGVNFSNSHSVFPTFTTPNGAAIATGHFPGDTGDFSNTIFSGYPVFAPEKVNGVTTNLGGGTLTPFVENDPVLGDLNGHFASGGSFFNEESLLSAARARGFNTAAVGKVGPTLIQDVTQGTPQGGVIPPPQTIIVDDSTGQPGGIPLAANFVAYLTAANLGAMTPPRGANGVSGTNTVPGTSVPNAVQQKYFADATSKAILPKFAKDGKPFVLVFWSRDPDGTQHNQGDSLNNLAPGINGPTSRAAVKNADMNLAQIINGLNANGLAANTDVIVTSDHGFGTISKQPVNALAKPTAGYAATQTYPGVNAGFLPAGFVAIDLAHGLGLPLYDPDAPAAVQPSNGVAYAPVDPTKGQRPRSGNGLIGGSGQFVTPMAASDASIAIAANGGSDLVYIPSNDPGLLRQVVAILLAQDYVSGLFVNEDFGSIPPGTLPLTAINLKGSTDLPKPAVVVNFATFSTDPGNPLMTAVEVADSTLQQGQGMHGTIGRHDTFNNMAAMGPDFKQGYVDPNPVGNADIAPTAAAILGFSMAGNGSLTGRVMNEALASGPDAIYSIADVAYSAADPASGLRTYLAYQKVGKIIYADSAGFANKTVGLPVLGGTSGDDTLGPDSRYLALDGMAGNDILIGTSARATMIGGPGADVFVVNALNGTTTIGDFSRSDGDKIGLSAGLAFSGLAFRDASTVGLTATLIYARRSGHLLAIAAGVSPSSFVPADFISY